VGGQRSRRLAARLSADAGRLLERPGEVGNVSGSTYWLRCWAGRRDVVLRHLGIAVISTAQPVSDLSWPAGLSAARDCQCDEITPALTVVGIPWTTAKLLYTLICEFHSGAAGERGQPRCAAVALLPEVTVEGYHGHQLPS
jgi:hypothetical protein